MLKHGLRYAPAWALLLFSSLAASVGSAEQSPFLSHSETGEVAAGHSQGLSVEPAHRPEMLEAWLASDLGQQLGMLVVTQEAGNPDPAARLKERKADAVLAVLPHTSALPPALERIDTGHAVAPMAIMRSDSSARDWAQLKASVVCLARDSRYAGMPAQQHGALERHFDSVAEALLALRAGKCEAVVHDDLVLERLLILPEWREYSARLPAAAPLALVLLLPEKTGIAHRVVKAAEQWTATEGNDSPLIKLANHIALEVYLKQDVPDCH